MLCSILVIAGRYFLYDPQICYAVSNDIDFKYIKKYSILSQYEKNINTLLPMLNKKYETSM